ncbi:hypothetical protein DLREEDagrD3_23250 [Denitratisoma sp. agr-D3]
MKSMHLKSLLIAALLLGTTTVYAEPVQDGGHESHHATSATAATSTTNAEPAADAQPWVDAIVRKVDVAGGRIMISHGPIPNLGMGAMTMVFPVRDTTWLADLKPATKLRVVLEEINGEATVVQLERIKK